MAKHPLETIKKLDPDFFDSVLRSSEQTFTDGALEAKTKYLIAMALDAAHGAAGGVGFLARQAVEHGASKEQIVEAIQVASHVNGVGSVYTASFGLADVFE
jgi:alkylhydroperoxidase/carboxymuconolactone decarboxylase family protein YurZ